MIPMTTYDGLTLGSTPGIRGTSAAGSTVPPVQGFANGTSNAVYGQNAVALYGAVCAVNTANSGYGVYAEANGEHGRGVYGFSSGFGAYGVCGVAANSDLSCVGVYGLAAYCGLQGHGYVGAQCFGTVTGVQGYTTGTTSAAWAVGGLANGGSSLSGVFSDGDLAHFGSGAKTFAIDHPLDPENRTLHHACVEAPEQKNIYDGIGLADAQGELAVMLPEYFEALNGDFRYQLTPLDAPAPMLHVKERIRGNRFVIAGLSPGQEIAWMVTGIRRDPTAMLEPFQPERDKEPELRGRFLSPKAFGRGDDSALIRRPDVSRELPGSTNIP